MTKKTDITIKLDSEVDSTITFTATVPADTVAKHLEDALHHLGHDVTVKGFRKGKAPISKLKETLDPQKITSHTLDHIFPDVIRSIMKDNKLEIVGNPTLVSTTTPNNADWTVTLSFPLLPKFDLKDYKKEIKKALSPLTSKKSKNDKAVDTEGKKLEVLLDTLLNKITLTVPESLITQEVNQSLVRLFDHTQTLGITVEQYLKSLGKDVEQIRTEYNQAAQDNLKIEFILDRIATDMDIVVTDEEIAEMINASGDQTAKSQLEDPKQKSYVKGILRKRKTIDALLLI